MTTKLKNTMYAHMEENILNFLSNYKIGNKIYPGDIKKKFGYGLDDIYNALNYLDGEIVDIGLEIICPYCEKSVNIYKTINSLPENTVCCNCESKLKFSKYIGYTIVIYILKKEVILNEK